MKDPAVPIPKVPAPVTFFGVLTLGGASVFSNFAPGISTTLTARDTATVNSMRPVTKVASFFVDSVVYYLSSSVVRFFDFIPAGVKGSFLSCVRW